MDVKGRRQFLTAGAGALAGALAVGNAADAASKPQTATADAATRTVTILNGGHHPWLGQGVIGDFYINTTTHRIFGPKSSHGWGTGTNLIGPRGATGGRGATGPQGSAGPQGVPGYSILHGTTPPSSSLGVDNDFYIDTSSTQLYGPKEGGVWGSPVSLTGNANITEIDGGSL